LEKQVKLKNCKIEKLKIMNIFKKSIFAALAVVAGLSLTTSCSDANEYEDTRTDNPSWSDSHPEDLTGTKWVRGSGIKFNAYGQEVQGFVESLDFVKADSVAVKMSEGITSGTWKDESNTERTPYYEYKYSNVTGTVEILKESKNDKGAVTKTTIFTGVAVVSGTKEIIALSHFGDTPVQTYLVKQ
jgi:hypothetical protein